MAKTSGPLSVEEQQLLQSLLARAKASGCEEPIGVMAAAFKRPSDSPMQFDSDDEDEFACVTPCAGCVADEEAKLEAAEKKSSSHLPVAPGIGSCSEITLPQGVETITDWGRTICQLPKVEQLGLSYEELVQDRTTHGRYLNWIYEHGSARGGRLQDFWSYLHAIRYNKMTSTTDCVYPGTSEVRKMKVLK